MTSWDGARSGAWRAEDHARFDSMRDQFTGRVGEARLRGSDAATEVNNLGLAAQRAGLFEDGAHEVDLHFDRCVSLAGL